MESRASWARGDCGRTNPARRPRRQLPRIGAHFRYGYADAFYTRLVFRARAAFDELERVSGRQLITPTGTLDFGSVRDPKALAMVLESVGVEHELLTMADARSRWPEIAVDTDVLWHPGAGVIDAESTVSAMLDAAGRNGARILTDWPVRRVVSTAHGYRLENGDAGTLDAERIVVAAGGWLPALLDHLPLPAAFRALLPPLQVSQEYVYHFPYRDGAGERVWPTFIHMNEAIHTYSLPGGRDGGYRGQKLAEYHGGRRIPSAL